MKTAKIGLLGFGNVGCGTYNILTDNKAIIEENKYLKRVIEHQRREIAILREKLTLYREHYSREDKFI